MGIGSFTTMATEAMGTRARMAHHKMSLNWSKRSCKYERNFEGTTIYRTKDSHNHLATKLDDNNQWIDGITHCP